jgi:hypothetical protein
MLWALPWAPLGFLAGPRSDRSDPIQLSMSVGPRALPDLFALISICVVFALVRQLHGGGVLHGGRELHGGGAPLELRLGEVVLASPTNGEE